VSDAGAREPRRIRDVDSAARALRIKALAWALVGSIPFLLIASHIGAGMSSPRLVTAIIVLSAFSVMYFGTLHFGDWLGRTAGSIYFSGGGSTPSRREYSLAESLIARGQLDAACAELERAAALYADDPEPALRLARLLRDRQRPEEAVVWFRAALGRRADAGLEIAATREIIEIYTHILRTPKRALPHLARLESRHGDSPAGVWARREMAEIRQAMQEEEA
jgi:tetratricopeptide (TPR) repeat protein